MSSLDKYLAGEPLNDELAALREGKTEVQLSREAPSSNGKRSEDPNRTLTRSEREFLKELRQSEGWPVLIQVLEKRLEILKQAAMSKSERDPLGNQVEIAKSWAYVALLRDLIFSFPEMVKEEIAPLDAARGK